MENPEKNRDTLHDLCGNDTVNRLLRNYKKRGKWYELFRILGGKVKKGDTGNEK